MTQPTDTAADNSGRITSGSRLADRYLVEGVAGYGGMATVFVGADTLLHRQVAIKVLNQQIGDSAADRESFLREARAAASLAHPGIAGTFDAGISNGWPFIVMEYLTGGSLKDLIDSRAPMDPHTATELAIDIAEALEYGHRHNVVHCDVKPQNILLDGEGHARIVDFGISQSVAATAAFTSTVSGTAGYVAPEQLEGLPLDGRADVYSLATVLYQMLTGRLPFEAQNVAALATRRLVADPVPILGLNPSLPAALAATVMRALERDRERRFESAAAFAAALRDAERGVAPGAPLPGVDATQVWRRTDVAALPPELVADGGRNALFWSAAAVLVAVLIALVVLLVVVLPNRGGTAAPTAAPQVTGLRLDQAATALQGAGLKVSVQVSQSDQPVGSVLNEDPAAGTSLTTRDTVTLTVSGGPGSQ